MSEEWTGKPIDRVDGRLKVTGAAPFSGDVPVANVAHAVIVSSTIARGRVTNIDARAAGHAPGVLAVLTHENAPRLPGLARKRQPNVRAVQALQDDRVLYDGQPIAVVVADSLERAQDAASLLRIRYQPTPARVEIEPAVAAGEAFTPPTVPPRPPADSARGDFERAYAAAPVRIDQTYTTPVETHHPMEPHTTVAVWQGDAKLTLYDATQYVYGVRRRLADAFGLPEENVRVVSRFVGGGFGGKGSAWSHVVLAAMAARACGRAVKLSITRAQMFLFVGHRPRTIQRVSLGSYRDGTLVAVRHDLSSYTSQFDIYTEPSAYATRMLYACANVRTSHRLVRLDVGTPTFTRAPGEASGSFALESAMDELAYAVHVDPVALRMKSYADGDADEGKPFSSKTLAECYKQGAALFGWERRPPRPRSLRDGRHLVGMGMATATYPARQSPCSALARLKPDGSVLVLAATHELGTGTYTVMTQVAADALGLPLERVRFDLGDTAFPEAPISAGSQTASSVGSAVRMVCLALREKMAASPGASELEVRYDEQEKADRKGFSCHAFGAQFAEVRVDEELGIVRVTRLLGAFAAGRILNPMTARSQLMGGMVWGIGMALEEDTVRDPRTGRVVTRDLVDYHVPVNADVPAVEILLIPEDDPRVNEVGAKGVGEIGNVGAAAAIANAVFHATGKRVRNLPITVDKLV